MTLLPDVPSGATWRCVDLHLYTPGVHTFALPGGIDERNEARRKQIADQYVERITETIMHRGKQSQALFSGRAEHTDLDLREPLDEAVRTIRKFRALQGRLGELVARWPDFMSELDEELVVDGEPRALAQGGRPLTLDQPEDDLDNRPGQRRRGTRAQPGRRQRLLLRAAQGVDRRRLSSLRREVRWPR